MGEIFLAEDTKLERRVALKFLPQDLTSDEEARLRFEREARAAAALNHTNIVTIYEIGEHEGRVFIAMEYVRGRTLREIISAGVNNHSPLQTNAVISIATQIAAGLAAAHAQGIVHRDIKPQNIIVGEDHGVKILDFGLAKLSGISTLTKGSMMLGTMHYVSPEQARGREADARSDLWALGVVLYEMLSGRLPFSGESPHAILYSVVKSSPAPLDEYRPGLPAPLLACVKRLLCKDPDKRYQDSGELMNDLEQLKGLPDGEGTEALGFKREDRGAVLDGIRAIFRPGASTRGARRRAKRRRWASALLAVGCLAALLILVPGVRERLRRGLGLTGIPRDRHLAVLPFRAAGDAESGALADGFTAIVTDKLVRLEKFYPTLWTVPASEILADSGRSGLALQRLWGCNLFVRGEMHGERQALHLRLRLQDARSGRELSSEEIQGHVGNLSLFQDELVARLQRLLRLKENPGALTYANRGGTAMPGAFVLYLKGRGLARDGASPEQMDKGLAFLEKSLRQDDSYIQARLALAEALLVRFRNGRDPASLREALEQGRRTRQAAATWAPAQINWALLLKEDQKREEARQAFREALRLDERSYQACIELAALSASMGRVSEAENLYKQALALRPGYPAGLAHMAYFYNLNGRVDEALACYRRMTELAPGDFNGFNNMGIILLIKGDQADARALFEKSNAIQPNAFAQSNLATLHFYEGDYRKALPLFREAAAQSGEYFLWGNLADTYRQLPEFMDRAEAAYRKAVTLAEAQLAGDPEDVSARSCLAMYLAHLGEGERAKAAISRARALAPADLETIRRSILVHEAIGERSQALAFLHEYRDRLGRLEEIAKEPDLAGLRRDPAYRQVIGEPQ
ncbi:MAG: protein kinase [Candidatus Aminicenantes bacterium]|nr:protein kinase [Candidatus Aminicenantes bacterium]